MKTRYTHQIKAKLFGGEPANKSGNHEVVLVAVKKRDFLTVEAGLFSGYPFEGFLMTKSELHHDLVPGTQVRLCSWGKEMPLVELA